MIFSSKHKGLPGYFLLILAVLFAGVVSQGCVVVAKDRKPKVVHKTTIQHVEPAPHYVEPAPHYVESSPPGPPAHAQSHNVAQGRPFNQNGYSNSGQDQMASGHHQASHADTNVQWSFDDNQRQIILHWYTEGRGTKKFDKIQKKAGTKTFQKNVKKDRANILMVKGDIYAGQKNRLPKKLSKQLPKLPKKIKRFLYGTQILLINWKSKRVLDTINLPIDM